MLEFAAAFLNSHNFFEDMCNSFLLMLYSCSMHILGRLWLNFWCDNVMTHLGSNLHKICSNFEKLQVSLNSQVYLNLCFSVISVIAKL